MRQKLRDKNAPLSVTFILHHSFQPPPWCGLAAISSTPSRQCINVCHLSASGPRLPPRTCKRVCFSPRVFFSPSCFSLLRPSRCYVSLLCVLLCVSFSPLQAGELQGILMLAMAVRHVLCVLVVALCCACDSVTAYYNPIDDTWTPQRILEKLRDSAKRAKGESEELKKRAVSANSTAPLARN
ncbi:hypothetical protein DQ04_16411000, partial [Trypanosoma grayi]|uniref:hypothetical protein n=1 Tax=Trypanosoma grayi TaxID=71804 RepID=UPI0004F3FC7C